MYCPNCGKENKDTAKFCEKCGAPLQEAAKEESVRPKKKGKKVLVILVGAILSAACIGVLFYLWTNKPVNQLKYALARNEIEEVNSVFYEIADEDEVESAIESAEKYVLQLKENYLNESEGYDYATVSTRLQQLDEGMLVYNSEVDEVIRFVEQINNSRIAYETAEKYQKDADYANAVLEYRKVVQDDAVYYDLAQSALTEVMSTLRESALEKAKAYEESGDYNSAQIELQKAVGILTNDSSLTSELAIVETHIYDENVKALIDEINKAIDEERYQDAFNKVNAGIGTYPDSEDLRAAKVKLESAYKDAVMKKLDAFYNEQSIEEALNLLYEAKGYLAGDVEIDSLVETYMGYLPVPLSSLEVYEKDSRSNSSLYFNETLTDVYGNTYSGAIKFLGYGYREHTYLINGKYNHIRGTLAYEYGEYTKGRGHLEIYSDGNLIYTSPIIGDDTEPFDFDVTLLSGCRKFTIKFVSDNERCTIIFANAQVYYR